MALDISSKRFRSTRGEICGGQRNRSEDLTIRGGSGQGIFVFQALAWGGYQRATVQRHSPHNRSYEQTLKAGTT